MMILGLASIHRSIRRFASRLTSYRRSRSLHAFRFTTTTEQQQQQFSLITISQYISLVAISQTIPRETDAPGRSEQLAVAGQMNKTGEIQLRSRNVRQESMIVNPMYRNAPRVKEKCKTSDANRARLPVKTSKCCVYRVAVVQR